MASTLRQLQKNFKKIYEERFLTTVEIKDDC